MRDSFHRKTLIFFCTMVLAAGAGRAAEIRLLAKAETNSAIIRLGDVAEIYGDKRDVAMLKQLELAVAPATNGVRDLSLREIRERLAIRGVDPIKHRLSGAIKVSVRNTATPYRSLAAPRLGQVEPLPLAKIANKSGSRSVTEDHPPVVVASRTLRAGDVIGRGDVRIEASKNKRPGFGVFRSIDNVIGMAVRSVVAAGRPLLDRDLQNPILVHRNSEARLVVRSGNVKISTVVKALANGSLNDFVAVEAVESKEKFTARVSGPHEVEILAGRATPPMRLAQPQSNRDRYTKERASKYAASRQAAPVRTVSHPRRSK